MRSQTGADREAFWAGYKKLAVAGPRPSRMFRTLLSSTSTIPRLLVCTPRTLSFRTAMSFHYKPNTEPPKDMTVFRNIVKVASDSGKFRRVLWTGRNSQVRGALSHICACLSRFPVPPARHHDHPRRRGNRRGTYPRSFS